MWITRRWRDTRELGVELPILPTTVIGSYPRPRWLRHMIRLWSTGRVDDRALDEAFRDSVRVIVREQEEAGIDIPSDGEMWRDEMVEYFHAKRDADCPDQQRSHCSHQKVGQTLAECDGAGWRHQRAVSRKSRTMRLALRFIAARVEAVESSQPSR